MRSWSPGRVAAPLLVTLFLTVGSAPGTSAKDPGSAPDPLVLTLGVADSDSNDSRPGIDRFVTSVLERSGGTMIIEPIYDAGGDAFERGTIERLLAGDFDLGLVGGRAWVAAGIPGMAALHAPMLIDSTPLAAAVTRGEPAVMALEQLSESPVVALAVWPETLRYFFGYRRFGPILTPEDLRGDVVKLDLGGPGQPFVEALGASAWTGTDLAHDVDFGVIQAADSNLHGRGLAVGDSIATGNVVLHPKLQTLVMRDAVDETLTPEQRAILVDAAADARETGIATAADEVAWAKDWCSGSGSIVLADPAAVDDFRAIAASVTDRLREDPATDRIIAAIETLKATTASGAALTACSPEDGRELLAATDTTGWNSTLPPDGSYRAVITREELIARGVKPDRAFYNAATSTWTFKDGIATMTGIDASGRVGQCQATMEPSPIDNHIVFTDIPGGDCGLGVPMVWREAEGGIELLVVVPPGTRATPGEAYDFAEYQAIMGDRLWTRID